MNKEHLIEGYAIETPRLRLVPCNREILETLFQSESALAGLLGINIPGQWTEFGEGAFRYTYDKIINHGEQKEWWSYLPILIKTQTLVGTCGYKGAPRDGRVEIGYEVAADYRRQGLATEMARAMVANAFTHEEVQWVQAHTLAMENESGSVLMNCDMRKVEEINDPEDGLIWRWEVHRKDFKPHPQPHPQSQPQPLP